MKVLVDMNLTPVWSQELNNAGIDSIHWSQVGLPNAPDKEILNWAITNGYVVFTYQIIYHLVFGIFQFSVRVTLFDINNIF